MLALAFTPPLKASSPVLRRVALQPVEFRLTPAHSFAPAAITFVITINEPNTEQICLFLSDAAGDFERTSCWPHRTDIKTWRPVISNIPAGEYQSWVVITVWYNDKPREEKQSVVGKFVVMGKG